MNREMRKYQGQKHQDYSQRKEATINYDHIVRG